MQLSGFWRPVVIPERPPADGEAAPGLLLAPVPGAADPGRRHHVTRRLLRRDSRPLDPGGLSGFLFFGVPDIAEGKYCSP